METKRAAIYTRVSSDEQVKGYSLDTQADKLRDYCKLHDLSLDEKHIFREEGVSGAEKNRPMLDKLVELAEKKEIDLVLVYKIDRLSRVLLDLLELTKRLEKNGVGLKSLTEPIDTTNPIGKCIFQILGSFAEFERGVIRERTIEGQIRHKREGYWTSGIPPYGYNYSKETKKLSVNKKEAEVVRKIYKLFVEERLKPHSIQTRLNALKLPTKFDNIRRNKRVNGQGFWNIRTISRILSNEVYTGTFTYRKYKYLGRVRGESNLRPQEEWITIRTPKIISLETFKLAEGQLSKNKTYSAKNAKHQFLFSRMIECGLCGCKYSATFNTAKNRELSDPRRYVCNGKMYWIRQEGKRCEAKSVVENRIEDSVWREIKNVLTNPAVAIEQLEKIYKKQGNEKELRNNIKELELLIAKAKVKSRKLIDLYLEGTISKDDYKAKSQAFEVQQKRYLDEKEKLSSTMIPKKEKDSRIDALKQMYGQFKQNLENITYEQKRELYKMLINKLVIKNSDLDIHCNIPYKYSFAGQSTHCLSSKNKSFTLILKTKVAERDYSEMAQRFFTEEGEYKKIPNHKPRKDYNLEYHISKTKNEGIKRKIVEIIELASRFRGTKIVYSKIRICFKTKFRFITLEILGKSIRACIKNENGWKCFNVKTDKDLEKIKKTLHRIHSLSRKPSVKFKT